jgi:carbamoyltransferase
VNVLGLAAGLVDRAVDEAVEFPLIDGYWHDAAAALLVDGEVVAAQEEERSRRLKHTSRFPREAVRFALEGRSLADVERVAVSFDAQHWRRFVDDRRLHDPRDDVPADPRQVLRDRLREASGEDLPADRLHFVRHHEAHAWAAFGQSGFDEALVLTLDGAGDTEAGVVALGRGPRLAIRRVVPIADSVGAMYLWLTRYLGFRQFDEYKVMGLASYGDPGAWRDRLTIFRLRPDGGHEIDWSFTGRLLDLASPRRVDEPVTQQHADIAAAAQDALEEIVLHVLRQTQAATGARRLCLGGGVAHNCALAGRIAESGRFDEVFVHPASHDAGCAVGAALAVDEAARSRPRRRIRTVAWGRTMSTDLSRWDDVVETVEPAAELETWAARQLAGGRLLPWVDGRAEFGPRALGHRSLLADPREFATRQLINRTVKRREEFRPFAPVVRAERIHDYFEVPPGIDPSFMSYAVRVRPEWADRLKAITHVDGTARLQSVAPDQQPRLCRLLDRFEALSGVGVLLNTSLNVAGEPIVDRLDDVVAFLLTTGIEHAVVDGTVLRARPDAADRLAVVVPDDARLTRYRHRGELTHRIERGGPVRSHRTLSAAAFAALLAADGRTSFGSLCDDSALRAELGALWRDRLIELRREPT